VYFNLLVFIYDTRSWEIRLITSKWILEGLQSVTRMCRVPEDTNEAVSPCSKQNPKAIVPTLAATVPSWRCVKGAHDNKIENFKSVASPVAFLRYSVCLNLSHGYTRSILEESVLVKSKVALDQVAPSVFGFFLSIIIPPTFTWIMGPTTRRRKSLSPYHGKYNNVTSSTSILTRSTWPTYDGFTSLYK
jgi:hypothetical protein